MSFFLRTKMDEWLSADSGGIEISEEMLAELKAEAIDLVENLASLCAILHMSMQHRTEADAENMGELFRILHTLKGLSQMAGIKPLVGSLHKVEEYLAAVRTGEKNFARDHLDLLNDLQDALEKMFVSLPTAPGASLLAVVDVVGESFLALLRGENITLHHGHASLAKGTATEQGAQTTRLTDAASFANDAMDAALASDAADAADAVSMAGTPAEDDANLFEATDEERALVKKFRTRDEGLYASVFPPGAYPDTATFCASDVIDNLLRVGDLIVARTCDEGSLVVCAAELGVELLEPILGNPVTPLPKDGEPCGALEEPWNSFFFGLEETAPVAAPSASVAASSAPLAPATLSTNVAAAVSTSAPSHPAPLAHAAAASAESDFEDFDGPNLVSAGIDLPDLDPEMLQDFLSNADELLETLAGSMLALEGNPDDKEAVDQIFRAAHTIKGTVGMFGFRAIERLCHVMENLFDRIRRGQLTITPVMVDALFFGIDRVKVMFDELKGGKSSELPINEALMRIKGAEAGIAMGSKSGASTQTSAPAHATSNAAAAAASPVATSSTPAQPHSSAAGTAAPSAIPASSVPASSAPPKAATPAAAVATKPKDGKENDAKKAEGGGTIRVDIKRLDSLVNLVGELVIDRTRFARIEEALRVHAPGSEMCNLMSESVLLFSRHMNEVQSIIMKVRMVPVGNAFFKFTRVVRDLARQVEKEIDLVIEGGETELDKTLVEEIGDPLVHLIRNSVDHGIEMPEVREAQGKSRKGTIYLKAAQDGNMIVITVRDDGKGLQIGRIREKAIANGLIKESDHLTDRELFGLIFEAGFSTAETVTNISGRGVGMDVVKRNIVKLKGIIELDSALGKGTTTTIKLPLTLAIIPSLMVGVKGECYAIPLVNVIETIRMDPSEVQRVGNSEFVKLREQVLPLMHMADVFNLHEMDTKFWYRTQTPVKDVPSKASPTRSAARSTVARVARPRIIFVVIGVGEKRVGVVVDELMGQQEIVIKSLGRLLGRLKGVAGGCVTGNGRVALVLDAGEMIEDFSFKKPQGNSNGGSTRAS